MSELKVTEYKERRVLTTQQLAESYGTEAKVISNNFNRNKERYQNGKHYILLHSEDLKRFKTNHQNDESLLRVNQLYLWTEKGAFLHAKSLNTDVAWEVYDRLVDTYFKVKKQFSSIEMMELQLQALKEVKADVESVNEDLQAFKEELPLLAVDCDKITTVIRAKGIEILGGKDSNAYADKSLRQKLYSDMHRELKRQFGLSTYKALRRNQCIKAVSLIALYQAPLVLQEEIKDVNSQIKMQIGA